MFNFALKLFNASLAHWINIAHWIVLIYWIIAHWSHHFVQGRNLVPSRPDIGCRKVNKPCQLIAGLLGTRFLPRTDKVSTCRKALCRPLMYTIFQAKNPQTGILLNSWYIFQYLVNF